MDEYDLARLTDFDFEKLCKDIFEAVLGRPLEIFAPGADGGVDLRAVGTKTGETTIVQCKHWVKSPRSALIRHMEQVERPKVTRLNPTRYILATTAELTVDAKAKLATILHGFLRGPEDLFGANELVAELRKRPEIVERHIRLWLSSASVLGALLNRDVHVRTRALADDIDETLRVYAPNQAYPHALDILDEHHSCLIVGQPGIGKTTLAHVLLADHRAKGFTIVETTGHLEDIYRIWRDDDKQIFFVDDFLGQTTLDEAAARVANQQLNRLFRDVRKSPKKRIVLTCRRYIVTRAQEHNERLAVSRLAPYECIVDATAYTRMVRAEIFHNHVYFSDLAQDQRARLAERHVYERIIDHENYSPRLLEQALLEATQQAQEKEIDISEVILLNL